VLVVWSQRQQLLLHNARKRMDSSNQQIDTKKLWLQACWRPRMAAAIVSLTATCQSQIRRRKRMELRFPAERWQQKSVFWREKLRLQRVPNLLAAISAERKPELDAAKSADRVIAEAFHFHGQQKRICNCMDFSCSATRKDATIMTAPQTCIMVQCYTIWYNALSILCSGYPN